MAAEIRQLIVKNASLKGKDEMNRSKWFWGTGIVFLAVIIVVIGVRIIPVQPNYPKANDKFVNDYAQVLKPGDVQNLRRHLRDLKHERDIEGTVLTVNSIEDYGTGDESVEAFTTNLFNTWE